MNNEPLEARALRVQYEMTEGFYDPEYTDKNPDTFVKCDKSDIPAATRDNWERMGAELAALTGVSQEAAENAILGHAIREWTDMVLSMTPEQVVAYKAEINGRKPAE
jgi:hypothetical protein